MVKSGGAADAAERLPTVLVKSHEYSRGCRELEVERDGNSIHSNPIVPFIPAVSVPGPNEAETNFGSAKRVTQEPT